MFEALLESLLLDRLHLGEWVEGIDRSSLKVAVWTGQIRLKELKLKPSALDRFKFPLKLKYGYLKGLDINVPWNSLLSSPLHVVVDGLYLIAEFNQDSGEEKQDYEQIANLRHQEAVANAEFLRQTKKVKKESSSSLKDRFTAKAIENLIITVKNVHIRYEHPNGKGGLSFAAGITLRELTCVTAPPVKAPVPAVAQLVYKIVKLSDFAIYWNSNHRSWLTEKAKTMEIYMFSTIGTNNEKWLHQNASKRPEARFNYILPPSSCDFRLTVNPMLDPHCPKLLAVLDLPKVSMMLVNNQYRDVVALLEKYSADRKSVV